MPVGKLCLLQIIVFSVYYIDKYQYRQRTGDGILDWHFYSRFLAVLGSGTESGSTGSAFFGLPGSGSISLRYGSGSFYNKAKIVRKTLISTISIL
jgi:hypothetical protein